MLLTASTALRSGSAGKVQTLLQRSTFASMRHPQRQRATNRLAGPPLCLQARRRSGNRMELKHRRERSSVAGRCPAKISEGASRAYSSGTTYYTQNLVSYSGGTYAALQNSFSGQAPSGTAQDNSFWSVVAAGGAAGTPATPPSPPSGTINLTSAAGVNLRSIADANGYTGLSGATYTFNVPNGVTIRGVNGGFGIDTGSWNTSSYTISLTLVVQSGGIVDGGGGMGGNASIGNGSAGGDAIYCQAPITVTINAGGTVRPRAMAPMVPGQMPRSMATCSKPTQPPMNPVAAFSRRPPKPCACQRAAIRAFCGWPGRLPIWPSARA